MMPTISHILMPSLIALGLTLSACQKPESTSPNQTTDKGAEMTKNAETSDSTLKNAEVASSTDPVAENDKGLATELPRYRWTLLEASDSNKRPIRDLLDVKDKVVLNFNKYHGQDSLNFSVGCNTMSSAYQLNNQTLTIEEVMSTKMLCDDLNDAENKLNELMQGNIQIALDTAKDSESPTLTLTTQDNSTLTWSGQLTAEAKYNTNGETLFWAVSADTKPCADDAAKQCLQVKSIDYNDEGIKTGEGKWMTFAGTIDGYQHDDKNDEVLRLQRYKTDEPNSTDGYAYVLDTVIEKSVKAVDKK